MFEPDEYLRDHFPGVDVYETDLPGLFQGCVDHTQGIIWLQRGLDPVARRCTLTFEIGQLVHGPAPADKCLAAARQRAATDWAAHMLIPSDMFVAAWANNLDLAAMAAFCRVDVQTFRARIRAASDADQDAAIRAIAETRLTA